MKLINGYHNKTNDVILKYLDEKDVVKFKKILYIPYFWVLHEDADKTVECLNGLKCNDTYSDKIF